MDLDVFQIFGWEIGDNVFESRQVKFIYISYLYLCSSIQHEVSMDGSSRTSQSSICFCPRPAVRFQNLSFGSQEASVMFGGKHQYITCSYMETDWLPEFIGWKVLSVWTMSQQGLCDTANKNLPEVLHAATTHLGFKMLVW